MGNRAEAIKFFNQAIEAINDKSKPSNATTSFQLFASACQMDPTWGKGWQQYAANCGGFGDNREAPEEHKLNWLRTSVAAYRRALQCENETDELVVTHSDMGWRLFTLGMLDEAEEHLLEATRIHPKGHHAWVNLSQVYGHRRQTEKALECAKKGYDLAPNEDTAEAALAFALLFARRLKEGFKHFEVRFKWRLHQFLQYPYPKWEGEDDKVVFLVADQGLGDTLCFARFIEKAAKKAKYLHLYIQPELMRLFMHAFVGIKNVNLLPFGSPFPQADVWTTFVSLPYALGLEDKEIRNTPQIKPPLVHMPTNWLMPDAKLHVGVCWKGSKLNDIDPHRSIPAHHFLELCRVKGVQLYSLQVGDGFDDLNLMGAGALVKNLTPYLRDVTDTVAILQNLDLVIGCESAVAHICTLANKEMWVPYSFMGRDYRYGHDGKDMLWLPGIRPFLQGKDRRWEPVFAQIVQELDKRVNHARERKRILAHA